MPGPVARWLDVQAGPTLGGGPVTTRHASGQTYLPGRAGRPRALASRPLNPSDRAGGVPAVRADLPHRRSVWSPHLFPAV